MYKYSPLHELQLKHATASETELRETAPIPKEQVHVPSIILYIYVISKFEVCIVSIGLPEHAGASIVYNVGLGLYMYM